MLAAAASKPDPNLSPLDPSPLAAIRKGFDVFLTKSGLTTDQKKADTKRALSADRKAEMFRQFLTWPQNPLEVEVVVRLTSESGVGNAIGSIAVKNSEVLVAGRREPALFLKPNLRGLRPGLYAFHVHEMGMELRNGSNSEVMTPFSWSESNILPAQMVCGRGASRSRRSHVHVVTSFRRNLGDLIRVRPAHRTGP